MRLAALFLLSILLAACASAPPPRVDDLFDDQRFEAPSVRVDPDQVLAVDAAMKRFLRERGAGRRPVAERRRWLVDALYSRGELQLEYDAADTRNAAEAFHARAGNCLSLVIMTAALAKEIGLGVRYQSVSTEETWGRLGGLYFSIGHVNLTLSEHAPTFGGTLVEMDPLTIDFLPAQDLGRRRTRELREDTVVAMYLNNRAVESLAASRLDDAYAWARAALVRAPDYAAAYNTLGLVYRRHHDLPQAERVLRRQLERAPDDLLALSNLALVLGDQGRAAEANVLIRRLQALQPDPPFAFFDRGRAALEAGDVRMARELFAREVARAPDSHEFHFWLAVAELRLGDVGSAGRHLAKARDASPTRSERELYAAKLDRLRQQTLR